MCLSRSYLIEKYKEIRYLGRIGPQKLPAGKARIIRGEVSKIGADSTRDFPVFKTSSEDNYFSWDMRESLTRMQRLFLTNHSR